MFRKRPDFFLFLLDILHERKTAAKNQQNDQTFANLINKSEHLKEKSGK